MSKVDSLVQNLFSKQANERTEWKQTFASLRVLGREDERQKDVMQLVNCGRDKSPQLFS